MHPLFSRSLALCRTHTYTHTHTPSRIHTRLVRVGPGFAFQVRVIPGLPARRRGRVQLWPMQSYRRGKGRSISGQTGLRVHLGAFMHALIHSPLSTHSIERSSHASTYPFIHGPRALNDSNGGVVATARIASTNRCTRMRGPATCVWLQGQGSDWAQDQGYRIPTSRVVVVEVTPLRPYTQYCSVDQGQVGS